MSIPIIIEEGNEAETQNAASIEIHKDTITPERIKQVNGDLIRLIKNTPQYQTGVVKHETLQCR